MLSSRQSSTIYISPDAPNARLMLSKDKLHQNAITDQKKKSFIIFLVPVYLVQAWRDILYHQLYISDLDTCPSQFKAVGFPLNILDSSSTNIKYVVKGHWDRHKEGACLKLSISQVPGVTS